MASFAFGKPFLVAIFLAVLPWKSYACAVKSNFCWPCTVIRWGPWAAFFCSVHVFQTSPNARASFAKQNSASAIMLTSRLRVEVWRCSNANHADTLVRHGNWRERSTRPELRRFFCGESSFRLTWLMIMIYTRFSADSRSSLTKNLAQPSPLLATCTLAIRTSRSLRYLATPKLVFPTPILAKRVSRSQISNFTRFLKYLEHQKWYLATSNNMAKRVVIEKSHHAWACVIGISQPFQLTLWLATALAIVTWPVRIYCASGTFGEREREREREREIQTDRERERRKWRHHCRAKIGDEFTLSLAKNSHNWRWAYTFPCQKFALFVSPFTLPVSTFAERSPWWRWNSQWVRTFHCQTFFRPQALFPLFQMARAARRVIENPRQMIKSCPVLFFFPSKNWIKLIPKTIGNRKRDCAWGGSGW